MQAPPGVAHSERPGITGLTDQFTEVRSRIHCSALSNALVAAIMVWHPFVPDLMKVPTRAATQYSFFGF